MLHACLLKLVSTTLETSEPDWANEWRWINWKIRAETEMLPEFNPCLLTEKWPKILAAAMIHLGAVTVFDRWLITWRLPKTKEKKLNICNIFFKATAMPSFSCQRVSIVHNMETEVVSLNVTATRSSILKPLCVFQHETGRCCDSSRSSVCTRLALLKCAVQEIRGEEG